MRIDLLTLFPEPCRVFLDASIVGRAQKAGLVQIVCTDIRDYTQDKHRTVDDRPFGGGPGMVMKVEPVVECVEAVRRQDADAAWRFLTETQGVAPGDFQDANTPWAELAIVQVPAQIGGNKLSFVFAYFTEMDSLFLGGFYGVLQSRA
mgnify:CR=1 FL=1